ncbi:MAG: hypothetical protein QG656_2222, partial [Candidatus Hydrogenedentes bacterium]|nr:hypothetical protein [Candidatus Hydrogenedentota bacterium]
MVMETYRPLVGCTEYRDRLRYGAYLLCFLVVAFVGCKADPPPAASVQPAKEKPIHASILANTAVRLPTPEELSERVRQLEEDPDCVLNFYDVLMNAAVRTKDAALLKSISVSLSKSKRCPQKTSLVDRHLAFLEEMVTMESTWPTESAPFDWAKEDCDLAFKMMMETVFA